MEFIDLKQQYQTYKEAIDAGIRAVLEHGRYINGPEIEELEQHLSSYVSVRHCLGVASGTDALEIALRALGIGPGDEVITVPFTWISTAEVISQVGATPVFVDIEAQSFNMDPDLIEATIRPATKAIIAVDLFGQLPDYARLQQIADRHGLALIEDAAQSFGATQHQRRSCAFGTIATTSFFPAKPFGCYGDGGAVFTSDAALADKMRAIRNHGGLQRHHHTEVGMNGRLDTIQAAVLLAKFAHFQKEVDARARIGARYSELLTDNISPPAIMAGNTHVYAQYTIRSKNRDALADHLRAHGIPTAIYYPKCLHEQPVFANLGYRLGDFPVAEKASREVLSLPMHPFLAEDEQGAIVRSIQSHLTESALHK